MGQPWEVLMRRFLLLLVGLLPALVSGCSNEKPVLDTALTPVTTELTYFKDAHGRYLHFKGINLGGNIKVPVVMATRNDETPETYYGHVGDEVKALKEGKERAFTYVGRPFSLQKADAYFAQMKALGFNSVRLLWLWEAVYPEKKFKPDTEYLAYFEELVKLAQKYGIYVMINLHENLWSRVFYSLYSEWPVCQQCCQYDKNDRAIDPDGNVHEEIVCNSKRKSQCCLPGDPMNMLWSLFPNRTRDQLGISAEDSLEVRAAKYRNGFSHRVSGDGAPIWATQVCVPEKNLQSPYWGVFKWLGTAQQDTGPLGMKLFATLKATMLGLKDPKVALITPELADQITAQLDDMEPYLPPDAFSSVDTYDGLPFTMWGINNGVSLATNICFGAFYAGDKLFPNRRAVEYGYADRLNEGVDIETFYTPEEAQERADELKKKGYTYVQVVDLKESLQGGFRGAWEEMARIGKKYPHVIGYDILNEPAGVYIMLSVVLGYLELGSPELVRSLVESLLKEEDGTPKKIGTSTIGELVQQLLEENLELLPKDNSDETRKALGVFGADLITAVGMNMDLDKNYLEPLVEYVGEGIAKVYGTGNPPANKLSFWIEPAHGLDMLLGGEGGVGGQYLVYATTPDVKLPDGYEEKYGKPDFVWAPHWYPDIYPFVGLNQPPRVLGTDEYDFRDYTPVVKEKMDYAAFAYDNAPFVMGEFGTYWNFRYLEFENICEEMLKPCRQAPEGFLSALCDVGEAICPPGYQQSRAMEYLISAQILDNYYEAFEGLFASNMVWVYTPDVHPKYGDWWDHEDFSLVEYIRKELEPDRYDAVPGSMPESYIVKVQKPEGYVVPRGHQAYVRPYARALSGKPISTHYYSDFHYFDPEAKVPDAKREFEVVFGSKETQAATQIFVPELPYPDGFFVWLSDGYAVWDEENRLLHYFPQKDEPGWNHWVRIRPPIEGQNDRDWSYFVKDGKTVTAD